MDFIFDCFFEEVLKTIERSGLRTRQSRQNVVDQLDSLINGCSAGQNVSHEVTSLLAVQSAIKYHQTIKSDNSEICRMGKYHNVLYVAVKIAWIWKISDSSAICALLNEIFVCEQTFERIFLGAIFGSNSPYFIAGWRSDFKNQDENCQATMFFIHHASKERLSFDVNGCKTPFIDIPIESCGKSSPVRVALQASAPEILMVLLRYGANPCPTDGGTSPILALLDKLLQYESGSYPHQLVSCLRILMLSIPYIELPYKPLLFPARKEMFHRKYSKLFADHLIAPNRAIEIPELKHLSKCAVREKLRLSYQLPEGIKHLNIPAPLKRYIDLLEE